MSSAITLPFLLLESQVSQPECYIWGNCACHHSRFFSAECFFLTHRSPGVAKSRKEPLLQWWQMVALPLYDSTLKHDPARLGLATGRELSSASPTAATQALPQRFRHMASPPLGTSVLWLHNQDALELPSCPVSDQFCPKAVELGFHNSSRGKKTGFVSSPVCSDWLFVAWNRDLVILAMSAV